MTAERAAPPMRSAARTLALGLVLPLAAGAVSVFAFAPFGLWPIAIATLAVLFGTWSASGSPRQAALSGYAFGLGYFFAGVSWVYVSMHDFGGMPAVLAAIATFCFCAYLALFPAAAGWIAARFAPERSGRRLALAAAVFPVLEWLRGTLFTGFAWLTVGSSQAPASPLAGFAPWLGVYGVTLAVALAAAIVAALATALARPRERYVLAIALAALFALGMAAALPQWTRPAGAPVRVALLQGNVPQEIKWRDEVRDRILTHYARMIAEAKARVVVIPETALPAFLDELPRPYLDALREAATREGKDVLLGTVERVPRAGRFDYYNSLVRITGAASPAYRKRHLVPFGEFIPVGFQWVLAILHIPMSDFTSGPDRQAPLEAGGVRLGVAICYEDVFGSDVIEDLPAAQVLVNVSNDAWFGESFASEQHLQNSQMRALETGRWMVRSTNTGVTAAIDERGRIVERLRSFSTGTLVADVEPREGMTPYALCGNAAALIVALAVALAAAIAFRRDGRGSGTAPRKAP